MSTYIPRVISTDTLTFFLSGVPYQVDKSFPGYAAVVEELKSANPDPAKLVALTQPTQAVAAAVATAEARSESDVDYLPRGVVGVTRSSITYNGEEVTGVLVDRIIALMAEGFDIMPMVRFMENLYQNPADFARDELYLWLETSNLPITEDGYFLAYKNVNGDFTSIHDGRTDNTPGRTVSMPRSAVDPVRDRTCSRGLHFCSASYLPNFSHGRNNTTIVLKINPADVVSIPSDYNNAKGRAWKYEVLSVFGEDPATKVWPAVVGPTGAPVEPKDSDTLDVTSGLGKSLYSLANQLGYVDRDARLVAAADVLYDEWIDTDDDLLDWDEDSFKTLTVKAAKVLAGVWQEALEAREKAAAAAAVAAGQKATVAAQAAAQASSAAKQAEIARINSLGIESLRREASKAGYPNAYKGPRQADLRAFLVSKL